MRGGEAVYPDLYLITDSSATRGRELLTVLEEALKGGVRWVQLREKLLPGGELLYLARRVRELTDRYSCKLLINERCDIALLARADGVHLPEASITPGEARRLLGGKAIIGDSTHNEVAIRRALGVGEGDVEGSVGGEGRSDGAEQRAAADFITFGPVFATPSKREFGEPLGLEALGRTARGIPSELGVPLVGLGGINSGNVDGVIKAGAKGVAVISAILSADDVRGAAEELLEKVVGEGQGT